MVITESEPTSLSRIRVETALSRFPIHRLSKKGSISINLDHGSEGLKWEVTYNVKHGQPGPLAYKLDTLVVNRVIDASGRPVPKIIRLGSLYEIAQTLSLGGDTNRVKKALHQNASAYVEFTIRYKRRDGSDKVLQQGDNRYGVVFTGEKLPDGLVADAVYLVLHDWYQNFLNDVTFRPLDYGYLKGLTPGAQRFYELLSFQVFGAIKNKRPRAKLLYSEYCIHAPQVRYADWDKVRKQMYKVHVPHFKSGYILNVDYEPIPDSEKPDWKILYTPGHKAQTEYRNFTTRKINTTKVFNLPPLQPKKASLYQGSKVKVNDRLLAELINRGITRKKACELLTNAKPEQDVMSQIHYGDSVIGMSRRGQFNNPAGFYISLIQNDQSAPINCASQSRLFPTQEAEYEQFCQQEVDRFISELLPSEEYGALLDQCRRENKLNFSSMSPSEIEELSVRAAWNEIKDSGRINLPSFEVFCEKSSRADD